MAVLEPSLYELNSKVYLDSMLQNVLHHTQGAISDDQSHRRRTQMISEASLVKGLELMYTVDPSEARGLRSLGQGEAIDSTSTGGILSAMLQQAIKSAQSTRPETGAG